MKKTKGLFAGDRPEGKMKINYRVKEIYRLEEKKLPKRGMKKKEEKIHFRGRKLREKVRVSEERHVTHARNRILRNKNRNK